MPPVSLVFVGQANVGGSSPSSTGPNFTSPIAIPAGARLIMTLQTSASTSGGTAKAGALTLTKLSDMPSPNGAGLICAAYLDLAAGLNIGDVLKWNLNSIDFKAMRAWYVLDADPSVPPSFTSLATGNSASISCGITPPNDNCALISLVNVSGSSTDTFSADASWTTGPTRQTAGWPGQFHCANLLPASVAPLTKTDTNSSVRNWATAILSTQGVQTCPYVTPGAIAYGSWPATSWAAEGFTAQGSSADYAYEELPVVAWASFPDQTVQPGEIHYYDVVALKLPTKANLNAGRRKGIKSVWVAVDGGAWTEIPVKSVLRGDKYDGPSLERQVYRWAVNPNQYSDGRHEARCIAVPDSGDPTCIQGLLNFSTQDRKDFESWSFTFNTNRDGTLARPAPIYINPMTGSDANSGTQASPVQTIETAFNKVAAAIGAGGDVGGGTILYDADGDFVWGSSDTPTYRPCASQYLKIMPAPGRVVRFTSFPPGTAGPSGGPTNDGVAVQKLWVEGVNSFEATTSNRKSWGTSNPNIQTVRVSGEHRGNGTADGLSALRNDSANQYGGRFVRDMDCGHLDGAFCNHIIAINCSVDGGGGDVMSDGRVFIDINLKNYVTTGGAHADVYQVAFGEGGIYLDGIHGIESMNCLGFNTGNGAHRFAFTDVNLFTSTMAIAYGGTSTSKNSYAYWGWDSVIDGPQQAPEGSNPLVDRNNGFVDCVFTNDAPVSTFYFGFGSVRLWAGMTYQPDNNNIAPSFATGLAGCALLRSLDLEWPVFDFHPSAPPLVKRAYHCSQYAGFLNRLNGASWKPVGSGYPIFEEVGFNGHACLKFTDSTTIFTSGQIPNTIWSSGGVTPSHWAAILVENLAPGVAGTLAHWGASGQSASLAIAKTAGDEITFRCASSILTTIGAAFTGRALIIAEYTSGAPGSLLLTIYNAANPSGLVVSRTATAALGSSGTATRVCAAGAFSSGGSACRISFFTLEAGAIPAPTKSSIVSTLCARAGIP